MMFHVKHSLDVQRSLRSGGVAVTDAQRERLAGFVERVLAWNEKINLISRRDGDRIWFSHVLHSLSPLLYLEIPTGVSILDLGTGGGFPGVPLAIVREDLRVTLLDSIRKKTAVLAEIVREIALENAEVVTARAEDLGKEGVWRGRYDYVIVRAVAPLHDLVRWSRPLVRRGGEQKKHGGGRLYRPRIPSLIALKGGELGEEIRTAGVKGGASEVEVFDIVFRGSEEMGLEGKKLVLVPL